MTVKEGGAVAIVASAGGIPALIEILRCLPATFALPILVTQHLPRRASNLDRLLAWNSRLEVCWALEADRPRGGCVYLAPPDMRLEVTKSGFQLSPLAPFPSSWLEAGDHLIDSMIGVYGARTIGIVLSGMLSAGVHGLRSVTAAGGLTFAQDRTSSRWFDMPAAAIDFGKAEIVLPPRRIALALNIISESWHAESAGCPEETKAVEQASKKREPVA